MLGRTKSAGIMSALVGMLHIGRVIETYEALFSNDTNV
jgi:hypothetical protein